MTSGEIKIFFRKIPSLVPSLVTSLVTSSAPSLT